MYVHTFCDNQVANGAASLMGKSWICDLSVYQTEEMLCSVLKSTFLLTPAVFP